MGPVVGKIDFFDSSSSYTTFDGRSWSTSSVTHYVAAPETDAAVAHEASAETLKGVGDIDD